MRNAFIDAVVREARKNRNIFLLTADLGYSFFEKFETEFSKRYCNVGVAEQNMIGIASGLALSCKTVIAYSIIPFVTMRCLEQINNDICMHNLNVKIFGMGAGFHYGEAGPTHYGIEDISLMRSLPNMKVVSPATAMEAKELTGFAINNPGPFYVRLSNSSPDTPYLVKEKKYSDKGILVNAGKDITIISTGSIIDIAYGVTSELKSRGIYARLINIHTIKPIDKKIILDAAKETKAIFTIEEHNIIGGLGTAVAEIIAESDHKCLFRRFALPDVYPKRIGCRKYLLNEYGLSAAKISRKIFIAYKSLKHS